MTNMASSGRITSCLPLLLLLLAVAHASAAGQRKQERILPAVVSEPTALRTPIKVTENNGNDVTQIGIPESEEDKINRGETDEERGRRQKEGKEEGSEEEEENDEEEEEEEEEEYESDVNNDDDGDDDDDDDEYEGELKAIAESHEAMSKDEARNSNVSRNEQSREKLSSAQNFDSHEKSDESTLDESILSNEAIISEVIGKAQDEEVALAELLKYKMRDSAKSKRVPTVKKELSTQREILLAGNETEASKSLLPSEDPVNRLNGETDNVRRRALEKNELTDEKSREGAYLQTPPSEIGFNNTYGDEKNPSGGAKRLDKRQETVLKDLKAYLLAENAADEERRRKLEELGVQERALAKSLLKLLEKLTEYPGKWQRGQKFLNDMENELEVSGSRNDSTRRSSTTSLNTVTPPSNISRKSRKKPRKKKKRLRQTTMTPMPDTSPLTTTDTWSQTTPQWQIAARLFATPHWQENNEAKLARMRIDPKSRVPSTSLWDLVDRNKSKNIPRTTNAEQKPPLLDEKAMTLSRLLGMRKINPHPLYLQDSREFAPAMGSDRLADYDSPEAVLPRLFNAFPPRSTSSSEYPQRRNENENDYQDDLTLQTNYFAHNQEYKPPSREFAVSRSWPDLAIPYIQNRPWTMGERPLFPISSDKWPWGQQSDFRYWPARGKYRNYWTSSGIEKNDDPMDPAQMKDWRQRESPFWEAGKSHVWLDETPSLWPQVDKPMKPYGGHGEAATRERTKSHPELNKKVDNTGDKVVLPKITMKTWNSLTSDPATWPYKLPSAKPWPKDENGKSYNPNADLIKKLGLDKENNNGDWSTGKNEKSGKLVFEKQTGSMFPKDSRKKELSDLEYKPIGNKGNYDDYRKLQPQEPMKEMPKWMYENVKQPKDWIKSRQVATDSLDATWSAKSETSAGNPWNLRTNSQSSATQLADGSNGAKSPNDENLPLARFLPFESPSADTKWLNKNKQGLLKYWTYRNNSLPDAKANEDFWRDNGSWLAKARENFWTTGMKSPTSWDSKLGDNVSWASRMNNNASWMPRSNNDADSWSADGVWPDKPNSVDSWSPSSNRLSPWVSSKGNNKDSSWPGKAINAAWSQKMKDNNFWTSKFSNLAPWKSNNDNWKAEQTSWRQNDDWNIAYGKNPAGTWPSKWKQFAYHKVTAVPILKPGTTADVSSAKSKNAFIAVSAVSSDNGNDWRKNDVREATREDNGPIYAWKKNDPNSARANATADPLENQLEALRQDDSWPYKQNEVEADEESVLTTTSTSQSAITANNTTASALHQTTSKAYQRELVMK